MKYLHYYENEEDFNAIYNGSGYTEPWVSLTKKEIKGDVTSFTIHPFQDNITFHFNYEESGQGWYESRWSDVYEEWTILSVESSSIVPAKSEESTTITVITVSGTVKGITYSALTMEYDGYDSSSNQHYWCCHCSYEESGSTWKIYANAISDTRNLQIGDTVILNYIEDYGKNICSIEIFLDKRNPEVGDIVEYCYYVNTPQQYWQSVNTPIVSVTREEGQGYVNTIDFNRIALQKTELTFEITSDGNIQWYNGIGNTLSIQYSKNGGIWTTLTLSTSNSESIPVVAGDILQFRGNNPTYCSYAGEGWSAATFSNSTANFKLYGNIMSMILQQHLVYLQLLWQITVIKVCSLIVQV